MPGRDRILDPLTRDYVSDGAGAHETTTTARTAIHHQLASELNAWWGDAESGSKLHTFRRAKDSDATGRALADAIRTALKPLVVAGRITEPDITIERDENGRLAYAASCTDLQSGETIDLNPLLSLGA